MTTPTPAEPPGRPLGETCFTLLLAWLIPGLGHILMRDVRRGVILFVLTQATFVVGLILHGAVLLPAHSPHDWGFNAVNILTFVVQLGNGLSSLLCLGMSQIFEEWAVAARAHSLFELGSVYLLMSGAVNSITVGSLYDRHLRRARPPSPGGGAL
jgi:hypothetical protein